MTSIFPLSWSPKVMDDEPFLIFLEIAVDFWLEDHFAEAQPGDDCRDCMTCLPHLVHLSSIINPAQSGSIFSWLCSCIPIHLNSELRFYDGWVMCAFISFPFMFCLLSLSRKLAFFVPSKFCILDRWSPTVYQRC
jgi:hypothetical protein